jgi:hypothetical protein
LSVGIGLAKGNAQSEKVELSQEEKERFINLGFSEQMIEDITEKEIARYDGETGEVISSKTKYYRITKDKKPVEITKDQALKEVKEYKEKKKKKEKEKTAFSDKNNTFKIAASDPEVCSVCQDIEQTSWMKMTTTATKIYAYGTFQDELELKNEFEWLTTPNWTLKDPLGMSYTSDMSYVQDSEFAKYTREDCVHYNNGTKSCGTYNSYYSTADKKSTTGLAFKIDIVNSTANDPHHRGYMTYRVKKARSSANYGNVYGHYSHVYYTSSYSISISTGQLSISGVASEKKMTDTGLQFKW